ncbi:MAG: CinA family protein [Dehalococcoidales bacterium]|nr:CinA family protein [Dehalococcoidales bacterium]
MGLAEAGSELAALLSAAGLTLGLAESCTGGLVASTITDIPGSSAFFWGGVVSYANEVKERVLGVPRALLVEHGAVSEEVARSMANGARELLGVDLALAITGIAGPGGGTDTKPVGLACLAVVGPWGEGAVRFQAQGDRLANRRAFAEKGIRLVISYVANRGSLGG